MLDALGPALQDHLMRAVIISGALALLLTSAVALVWWRGRRWTKSRSGSRWSPAGQIAAFSRMDEPTPTSSGGESEPQGERRGGGADQLASRLVRDAAVRAAALRDAWDRSYREAREPRESGQPGQPEAPSRSAPGDEVSILLQEVLREQRETNVLLRELIVGLKGSRD